MSKTDTQTKLHQLNRRIETLERMVHRFVPTDDEGEYTQDFLAGLDEATEDIAAGRVRQIDSPEDIFADQ